jgi:tRNA pseudouridine55 synthase
VCFGRATRLAQFLSRDEKEYVAKMYLGFATDTGDLTGRMLGVESHTGQISENQVRDVLEGFLGEIEQVPPMYAAKKVGGKRLYDLARKGIEIERRPVNIRISELELIRHTLREESRSVTFRVTCSSGTYIRVLAADIGQRLGCGAHLLELRRTRSGRCRLGDAVTVDELRTCVEDGRLEDVTIDMKAALDLTEVVLSEEDVVAVGYGRRVATVVGAPHGLMAALCRPDGELIGIGEFDEACSEWRPRVVLNPA